MKVVIVTWETTEVKKFSAVISVDAVTTVGLDGYNVLKELPRLEKGGDPDSVEIVERKLTGVQFENRKGQS